jgi:hypothetical protein
MKATPGTGPCKQDPVADQSRLNSPWTLTQTGRAVDLLDPRPGMIDIRGDIAPALGRLARFNGQVPGGAYSVAQHCVMGARALLDETGRPDLAAAFLLHDAHEAYLGDLTTPAADALASVICRLLLQCGCEAWIAQRILRSARRDIADRLDRAIFRAAGLRWPLSDPDRYAIKRMDARCLGQEARQLMPASDRPFPATGLPPIRMRGKLTILTAAKATEAWLELFDQLCPAAQPVTVGAA